MLKLNKIKVKIDSLSQEINYSYKQNMDSRYMNFFLPQVNDSLVINDNILRYINTLSRQILVASNLPIAVTTKKDNNLIFMRKFLGKKMDIFLYKISNQKNIK